MHLLSALTQCAWAVLRQYLSPRDRGKTTNEIATILTAGDDAMESKILTNVSMVKENRFGFERTVLSACETDFTTHENPTRLFVRNGGEDLRPRQTERFSRPCVAAVTQAHLCPTPDESSIDGSSGSNFLRLDADASR